MTAVTDRISSRVMQSVKSVYLQANPLNVTLYKSHSVYTHKITNLQPACIENNVTELRFVSLHTQSQMT